MLMKNGKLDHLKDGPVYWVDASDIHPCMATASCVMWTLKCRGKQFHSGLPYKACTYHLYMNHACCCVCTCMCVCVRVCVFVSSVCELKCESATYVLK